MVSHLYAHGLQLSYSDFGTIVPAGNHVDTPLAGKLAAMIISCYAGFIGVHVLLMSLKKTTAPIESIRFGALYSRENITFSIH